MQSDFHENSFSSIYAAFFISFYMLFIDLSGWQFISIWGKMWKEQLLLVMSKIKKSFRTIEKIFSKYSSLLRCPFLSSGELTSINLEYGIFYEITCFCVTACNHKVQLEVIMHIEYLHLLRSNRGKTTGIKRSLWKWVPRFWSLLRPSLKVMGKLS